MVWPVSVSAFGQQNRLWLSEPDKSLLKRKSEPDGRATSHLSGLLSVPKRWPSTFLEHTHSFHISHAHWRDVFRLSYLAVADRKSLPIRTINFAE